jgi:predicted RNase H-like HicB family nuclease
MLIEYVQAAMERARYKLLEDDTYFGEIPECPGVWANEPTLERCRETLREVLEEWLVLKLKEGEPLPSFGRHRIILPHSARA